MEIVTFFSDYGLKDDFVGVCHGVTCHRPRRLTRQPRPATTTTKRGDADSYAERGGVFAEVEVGSNAAGGSMKP